LNSIYGVGTQWVGGDPSLMGARQIAVIGWPPG